jgi:hypothetical protein
VGAIGWSIYKLTQATGRWSNLEHWWVVPILIVLALYGYLRGALRDGAYDRITRLRRRRYPTQVAPHRFSLLGRGRTLAVMVRIGFLVFVLALLTMLAATTARHGSSHQAAVHVATHPHSVHFVIRSSPSREWLCPRWKPCTSTPLASPMLP